VGESDGIAGTSLNGVRKLIEDKSIPEEILDALDAISGAVIALSPLVAGPAGIALWPLLEPKDALVSAAKAAIRKLSKSQPRDYLDQARRFAAANTMLTFTAYFDALNVCLPDLDRILDLGEKEKQHVVLAATGLAMDANRQIRPESLAERIIEVPHPADAGSQAAAESRRRIYESMGSEFRARLAERLMGRDLQPELGELFNRHIPGIAEEVYQAEFAGMAIDSQPFLVWTMLHDQVGKDALLQRLGDELQAAGEDSQLRFELLGAAIHQLDLGLDRLSRAITAQPMPSAEGPRHPESAAARAAEALRRRYAAETERPVIDDRYDPSVRGPRLGYPGNAAAYVPQAYRQVRYKAGETHLERDEEWASLPVGDDLGPAITRYLESPYGAQSPLLILGHPGSGKSLLTKIYSARLEYPRYTVVRVELRDADPTVSIQKQVEDQVRKDTGYDVNWADQADNLPLSPPVVILDGYDELLQATGKLFTDYLDQVQRFQRDALIQNRPVRVIVTSRITLIDKAIIPPGTTVVRLEPFDEPRRAEWISRWNAHNAVYFRQSGVKPFTLPDNERLAELAEQPLLLLMLAIFDSADNALSKSPDLDQTLLYDALLRRFIERELGKGSHGAAFSGLPPDARRPLVDRELTRLGVAAIGMFNRQEVKILRDQLDRDLAYYAAQRPVSSDLYGQSQSEILLGSFFFIHESRSRLAVDGRADTSQPAVTQGKAAREAGPTAFEFLHSTFGEFLAADFILRHVIDNAATIRDLTGKLTLEHALQQHLTTLTPYWFASLLYTPLHTRPNILALLREWSFHRIPADPPSRRAELLSCLDEIVRVQLRVILAGTDSMDLSARARATTASEPAAAAPPYDPLPVLGQIAVYTLNLILLRTYLADRAYTLDESRLDAGDRPWDRLTALWRSWFTPEILAALALQLTSTRGGTQVIIEPARLELVGGSGPLGSAFNAAIALADNLTASSVGLHLVSLMTPPPPEAFLRTVLDRCTGDGAELDQLANIMRRRLYSDNPAELAADVRGTLSDIGNQLSGAILYLAELADRTMLTPRQRVNRSSVLLSATDMLSFSRYASALLTSLSRELDEAWLPRMLDAQPGGAGSFPGGEWNQFVQSPAAAPVLRAAIRLLSPAQCADLMSASARVLPRERRTFFDVDTAAAFAVLAWRGADDEVCGQTIDAIIGECERGAWTPLDIPLETWSGVADLFVEGRPVIASRRAKFAAIVADGLDGMLSSADEERNSGEWIPTHVPILELWLQVLRIGALRHRKRFLRALELHVAGNTLYAETQARRCFLLLVRWARENGETQFLGRILSGPTRPGSGNRRRGRWCMYFGASEELGPGAIDYEKASADLGYREAMDLRWALDLWRESGGHSPG